MMIGLGYGQTKDSLFKHVYSLVSQDSCDYGGEKRVQCFINEPIIGQRRIFQKSKKLDVLEHISLVGFGK